MEPARRDEWRVIESLLPPGWREAARTTRAFRRARYMKDPAVLARLLLFHAVNDGGLRATVAQAGAAGIAKMSQVALLKRLRTASGWLAWMSAEMCRPLREQARLPEGLRPRAIDSTTIQGPGSAGTEWRLHYTLDLLTLACDWHELTDAKGAELLERAPMRAGDVMLGDRNFLRPKGVLAAVNAGAHVLVRLRWSHAAMVDRDGRPYSALRAARKLRVGQIGEWRVRLPALVAEDGTAIDGRVVAVKLPAPLAKRAERRATRRASKSGKRLDPRTLQAAHYVMLFTTLPKDLLAASAVLALYRYRWQIELAFKRLKQLLKLGRLPHQDPDAAKSWILAKMVVALLLETLYRNASVSSPWGYHLSVLESQAG
ncbi:MAG: IS4 family transposase [Deltaproteobacteria bacterium]|nr:IS4 family transposase [Deltaproteobacteria bacterium]